jgi:sialidase-1
LSIHQESELRLAAILAAAVLLFLEIATMHVALAEESVEKVDLFRSGQDGYDVCRIPGIVVTPKGTILTYCEARRGRGDWGSIDILLRRGTLGGKTWSAPHKIAEAPLPHRKNPVSPVEKQGRPDDLTYNNPVAIVDPVTGAIHFLFCLEYERCFYQRSDDDGVSFSPPVEITATFAGYRDQYDWKVLATGPGHGVRLASGRLVVPIWMSLATASHAHRPSAVSTIFSDDAGRTWQRGDIVANHGDLLANPSEMAVVELADQRVMLNIRSESPQHRRAIAVSPDGATRWTAPQFDSQLPEPICMGSLCRFSAERTQGKNRLLFANPNNLDREDGKQTPGVSRDRKNLTIRLSYDEGRSWAVSKTLEAGPSAYSDLAVGPEGTIYCFYERGRRGKDKTDGLPCLTLVKFNLEWLTDGKDHFATPK